MSRWNWPRILVATSIAAAMALVAQSEVALALAVGWPGWIAWCAAVTLDSYVLAAVLAGRDILVPVLVSGVSVVLSHGVYAAPVAWASGQVGQGHLIWPLAAGCSVVPLLVAWRVHGVLERKRTPRVKGQPKPQVSATVVPDTVPEPVPVTLHSVSRVVPDDLGQWVRDRWNARDKRADVVREGASLYGVSGKTVGRRWDKLAKEGAA